MKSLVYSLVIVCIISCKSSQEYSKTNSNCYPNDPIYRIYKNEKKVDFKLFDSILEKVGVIKIEDNSWYPKEYSIFSKGYSIKQTNKHK